MPAATHYAVIGAGPAGLAAARQLQKMNLPFVGFEAHSNVGGLWDITNPRSTMYESAHLISSKRMTEFKEFPMKDEVAEFPRHDQLAEYFRDFAQHFKLDECYKFGVRVESVVREGVDWRITASDGSSELYKGVLIANGTLAEPNMPTVDGEFAGELLHSSAYKSADVFSSKRVLLVGAGNSACDIAIDAVHRAKSVDISVRRGYHFVPKYVFGKPADTLGGKIKMPRWLKQRIDKKLLGLFTGDPTRYGFPEPDHKIYEAHPIVNSMILYHLGHGDIAVKKNIKRFDGNTVVFADDASEQYDLVMMCTGYKLHYPFISQDELNWQGAAPSLYLNCMHPDYNNLFIMGLIEGAGVGWEGRSEQAEMVARYIKAVETGDAAAKAIDDAKQHGATDISGGFSYLKLDRMAYYVHKDTFLKEVRRRLKQLRHIN